MLKPTVKITTIKMLAQLLAGAEFIDEETTLELLLTIFKTSTHIDVRAAVIESLVTMMRDTNNETTKTKILEALEQHAVPVAAALNESHPLSEADWQRAESDGELPKGYRRHQCMARRYEPRASDVVRTRRPKVVPTLSLAHTDVAYVSREQ